MSFNTGKYQDYHWLQTDALSERDLLDKCDRYLMVKYLAITAFDSGELTLLSDEVRAGWKTDHCIAYSPKLDELTIDSIPYDGFDEWFFLENSKSIRVKEVYVNYAVFNLSYDQAPEGFWQQIFNIEPFLYVADGMRLTVITKEKSIIETLQSLPLT